MNLNAPLTRTPPAVGRAVGPAARVAVLLAALAVTLGAAPAHAQDRADIDRTTITGHKELPRVLYIVPWKKPLPGATASRPRTSLLDDALAPIDRDEFRRHLDFRAQIAVAASPSGTAPAATPAAPPVPPVSTVPPTPVPTPAPQEKQP